MSKATKRKHVTKEVLDEYVLPEGNRQIVRVSSGGTSNRKLELLVAGASDLSARVQKLIAWKLRADDILIATHAPDACVAQGWPKLPNLHLISRNKMLFRKSPCQPVIRHFLVHQFSVPRYTVCVPGMCRGAILY